MSTADSANDDAPALNVIGDLAAILKPPSAGEHGQLMELAFDQARDAVAAGDPAGAIAWLDQAEHHCQAIAAIGNAKLDAVKTALREMMERIGG